MNIFYFKFRDSVVNFGDNLNIYLWKNIFPWIESRHDNVYFIGCGSILNNKINEIIPEEKIKVVFGAGHDYGEKINLKSDRWDVFFVRGPLTADRLSLTPDKSICDSAYLSKIIYSEIKTKKYQTSFMPHINQEISSGERWRNVCRYLNINYIDPTNPDVLESLNKIKESSFLITEAMHGAIIADSFRVPWAPIVTNKNVISEFKWFDFCQSISQVYRPINLITLWNHDGRKISSCSGKIKEIVARNQIKNILKYDNYYLSKDSIHSEILSRLNEQIYLFSEKYKER